jgi:hypothetical protein
MNWNISIAYPWWFFVLCVAVGAGYAALLYYKTKSAALFNEKPFLAKLLPALRFLLASVLAFFLLGPILKYAGFVTEKPIVSILVDNSNSLVLGDNAVNKQTLQDNISSIQTKLDDKFEVDVVSFSNTAQFSTAGALEFTGSESNISGALNYANNQYVNQNLGAVILVSDGIYNAGNNPVFGTENARTPIYTLALGDTSVYADIAINNVSHNSIAYLGNEFTCKIETKATKLKGNQANLQVYINGQLIQQKMLNLTTDNVFLETDVVATAKKLGQNKLDVRVTTFDNEKNKQNNNYTFYIDVIDGKKKVAIWAKAPHPDVATLQSSIQNNQNYEVVVSYGNYEVNTKYDLVILHNWFGDRNQATVFEKLKSSGIPVWVVLGNQFNSQLFNAGSQAVKFTQTSRGDVAALPAVNGDFQYFEISKDDAADIGKWPPLKAPFGKYSGYKPADVAIYQTIGTVKTQEPLLLLTSEGNYRFGLLTGTGIWQWKFNNYETKASHNQIYDLITKTVQYLAVKEDKKLLKVYPSAKQYGIGENVTLLGELYNQSLDPIANQEINIDLKNAEGKVYKHTMSANGKQYRLVLKNLEAGAYQFAAKATVGGVKLSDNGYFTIVGQQKELANLTADYNLMRQLSANTGGAFNTLSNADKVVEQILANENLKSVISEENKLVELIKFKWVFWLMLTLLSAEWFIRKWLGGY